ncbi:DUF6476 family protein [Rhizobium sp.]
MTNPNLADEQEPTLDPALEKVRRKMVRLLIISSLVIILGLMAVVYSIVYRVNKLSPSTSTAPASELAVPPARQSITLPAGFVVESTSIEGNRILITGTAGDGGKRMIVHDIGTGKTLTEIELK